MSSLASRRLLLSLGFLAAWLPEVLLGGSASTPDIVGSFVADGDLSGTAKIDGVKSSAGMTLTGVPLEFSPAHGAELQTLHGTWKTKNNGYSANFSDAFEANTASANPGSKVTAKLLLKKLEVTGDDLTSKLIRNFSIKNDAIKSKVKMKGPFIGVRV